MYKTIPVGALETNCYLIQHGTVLYIIDPGAEAENIVAESGDFDFETARVLLTHAHVDHISGLKDLVEMLKIDGIYMHRADYELYRSSENAIDPWYPLQTGLPEVTFVPWSDFKVVETPGHTPGGVCYYFEEESLLFSGDTLFAGSVGRTDLPGGNQRRLLESIRKEIFKLGDDVRCLPGHGCATTVGEEKRHNPYL